MGKAIIVVEDGTSLSKEYISIKMKRKMIRARINALSNEQVDLLYSMVKRWTKE